MRVKRLIGSLSAVLLAASLGPAAAQVNLVPQTTTGGISWVSGGIGLDEAHALRKVENEYNMRLLFAVEGSGEYLADVVVIVQDQQGQPILEATAMGPRLLAQVPPGAYTVTVTSSGSTATRRISVPNNGAAVQAFYFPAQ